MAAEFPVDDGGGSDFAEAFNLNGEGADKLLTWGGVIEGFKQGRLRITKVVLNARIIIPVIFWSIDLVMTVVGVLFGNAKDPSRAGLDFFSFATAIVMTVITTSFSMMFADITIATILATPRRRPPIVWPVLLVVYLLDICLDMTGYNNLANPGTASAWEPFPWGGIAAGTPPDVAIQKIALACVFMAITATSDLLVHMWIRHSPGMIMDLEEHENA
jgi:hypothetical protein